MYPWSLKFAPALLACPMYKSFHATPLFCAVASGPLFVIAMPFRNVVVVFVLELYCIVAKTHWPRTEVEGVLIPGKFDTPPYHVPEMPTAVENLSCHIPKYSWQSDAPVST